MSNTGYKIYTTLLKVSDDVNQHPLDVNGQLCSISGLPQDSKSNTSGQPDYVAPTLDYTLCPVNTPSNGIELRFGIIETGICTNFPELCYTASNILDTGSEIFIDISMSIPYSGSANFVVKAIGGSIYNLTGNLVNASTGNLC